MGRNKENFGKGFPSKKLLGGLLYLRFKNLIISRVFRTSVKIFL